MAKTFECFECHERFPIQWEGRNAHARHPGGALICPDCLARKTVHEMKVTGKATLYLVLGKFYWEIQDFFGVLKFPTTYFRNGDHNIAGNQVRFRFTGPDGMEWSGFQVGDNMIAHCKRTRVWGTKDKKPLSPHVYFTSFYEDKEWKNKTG